MSTEVEFRVSVPVLAYVTVKGTDDEEDAVIIKRAVEMLREHTDLEDGYNIYGPESMEARVYLDTGDHEKQLHESEIEDMHII